MRIQSSLMSPSTSMSMSEKICRLSKNPKNFYFFHSIWFQVVSRIPALTVLFILIFLWSSSTTIISGNLVHLRISYRKLNDLYCLSAGTQPNFSIINSSALSSINSNTEEAVNTKDEEIISERRAVEEQLQLHRSWKSNIDPRLSPTMCEGRGIYVYDLPSKFNKDLVGQCGNMIPWIDFCKHFENEALGKRIEKLGKGWFNTHQYSLEPIFHSRILKHPCRVYNENEAKLFYVPYYAGLDILRWHFKNVSADVKDALALDLVKWLESKKSWVQNLGKDHVFVLGKISWDFRRKSGSSWGTKFLELEQMQNPIKLLIERHPWEVNDIGIPHPTYFHPHSDHDIVAWQRKIMRQTRKSIVSFAGKARPRQPESIRSILINQCTLLSEKCRFLDCKSGGCDQPETIIELFMESEFGLQPPGDCWEKIPPSESVTGSY